MGLGLGSGLGLGLGLGLECWSIVNLGEDSSPPVDLQGVSSTSGLGQDCWIGFERVERSGGYAGGS